MSVKIFPEPDFEKLRDPDADEGHNALLDACMRHYKKRPHVWQIACQAAKRKVDAGRKHSTIQAVIEEAREIADDTRTADERGQEFKIANADAAFFSRAMAELGIVPPAFFDFSEQPSKTRKAPKKAQTPASVKADPLRPKKRR